MKLMAIFLVFVLAMFQYEIWIDQGGWHDMWTLEKKLNVQTEKNNILSARNQAMYAEIEDLQSGQEAVMEVARSEYGYIKKGEKFYRIR